MPMTFMTVLKRNLLQTIQFFIIFKDLETNAIKSICNFSASNLSDLQMIIMDNVSKKRSVGRGRKKRLLRKDVFVSLCVLKINKQ